MKAKKNQNERGACNSDSCELDFIKETINTDPLGMYTGVPENPFEKPVQDADDL